MVFTLSNGIVSDENTKCLGVNSVTDAPSGWATPGFDDSAWESAKVCQNNHHFQADTYYTCTI